MDQARAEYAAGLAIAKKLAAAEPGNAQWQRDLSVSLWKMAQLEDPDYPWSRVFAKLEAMVAAGTLRPTDMEVVEKARRLAGVAPPPPPAV